MSTTEFSSQVDMLSIQETDVQKVLTDAQREENVAINSENQDLAATAKAKVEAVKSELAGIRTEKLGAQAELNVATQKEDKEVLNKEDPKHADPDHADKTVAAKKDEALKYLDDPSVAEKLKAESAGSSEICAKPQEAKPAVVQATAQDEKAKATATTAATA